MIKRETSQFLDRAMGDVLAASTVLPWSEEGKTLFVRTRMDAAYAKAREIESGHKAIE